MSSDSESSDSSFDEDNRILAIAASIRVGDTTLPVPVWCESARGIGIVLDNVDRLVLSRAFGSQVDTQDRNLPNQLKLAYYSNNFELASDIVRRMDDDSDVYLECFTLDQAQWLNRTDATKVSFFFEDASLQVIEALQSPFRFKPFDLLSRMAHFNYTRDELMLFCLQQGNLIAHVRFQPEFVEHVERLLADDDEMLMQIYDKILRTAPFETLAQRRRDGSFIIPFEPRFDMFNSAEQFSRAYRAYQTGIVDPIPNVPILNRVSALLLAIEEGMHIDDINWLIDSVRPENPRLFDNIGYLPKDMLERVLDQLQATPEDIQLMLIFAMATETPSISVVKLLVERGADPSKQYEASMSDGTRFQWSCANSAPLSALAFFSTV